jgi:hypothetical protein
MIFIMIVIIIVFPVVNSYKMIVFFCFLIIGCIDYYYQVDSWLDLEVGGDDCGRQCYWWCGVIVLVKVLFKRLL